jgi:hypothetical protein
MRVLAIGLAACGLLAAPLHAEDASAEAEAQDGSAVKAEPAPSEKPPLSLAKTLDIPGVSPRLDLTAFVQGKVSGDGDGSARFTGRTGSMWTSAGGQYSPDGVGVRRSLGRIAPQIGRAGACGKRPAQRERPRKVRGQWGAARGEEQRPGKGRRPERGWRERTMPRRRPLCRALAHRTRRLDPGP